jgi:AraC-like DNA-binding protein
MRDISATSDCPKAVACTLRRAQLDRVGFSEVCYPVATKLVASSPGDCYQVQLTLAGQCEISTGPVTARAGPGSFVVINPRTTYRKRWSSDARQLMIRLPRRTVEQLASAESSDAPVLFDQSAQPMPGALRDLIDFIWRDITTDGRRRSAVVDRSASRHLVRAVLHLLPNSAGMVAPANELPACLARADRFIRNNLARSIVLADIADAAGVSTRGLESAFRRHWRTTPVTHLRNVRLDTARRMLTEPTDGTSVTNVALAVGFSHFGRFSQEYSRRFGELPSESLRRAPATN